MRGYGFRCPCLFIMPTAFDINDTGKQNWFYGDNARVFKILSVFLNVSPDYISSEMIQQIAGVNPSDEELVFSYASLVAAACGLDIYSNVEDRRFFRDSFLSCFSVQRDELYKEDPFYKHIIFPSEQYGKWRFSNNICKAYESFVCGDPVISKSNGGIKVTPRIGFFKNDYRYPAVWENGREWMTLMPNETNTTKHAISSAHGRVLTFGLGLGYFAYMASLKDNVESVTVVELSEDVIILFEKYILPQFEYPSKINLIKSDAFSFAENNYKTGAFDSVFTDIWHDPSDGTELYLKMKSFERLMPCCDYEYWLENTLKLYI